MDLIMQFSSPSRHFVPLRSKRSHKHALLKNPQCGSLFKVKNISFTAIQTTGKTAVFAFLIFVFFARRWQENILDRLVASIPRIWSVFNFFVNAILICYRHFQIHMNFSTFSNDISCFLQILNPVAW
jgi:hypothetical protein